VAILTQTNANFGALEMAKVKGKRKERGKKVRYRDVFLAHGNEPSMPEILAAIRRIVAEDERAALSLQSVVIPEPIVSAERKVSEGILIRSTTSAWLAGAGLLIAAIGGWNASRAQCGEQRLVPLSLLL
jgi:hypothetical protein